MMVKLLMIFSLWLIVMFLVTFFSTHFVSLCNSMTFQSGLSGVFGQSGLSGLVGCSGFSGLGGRLSTSRSSVLRLRADGTWQMSKNQWRGVVFLPRLTPVFPMRSINVNERFKTPFLRSPPGTWISH
jgi:hypothetical protein